ncbi:MAG: hypothetical protein WAT17_01220 [Candidatus Saccharimonadales bacterium]|jgi:hypothetical protein
MNNYIKQSSLSIVAVYALFAAIVSVMYVLGSVTQTTLVDWLVKGGLIAGIVFLLNVVLGFLSKRDK